MKIIVNSSAVFVEAILEWSFCFSYTSFLTAFVLNHAYNVLKVAGNVVSYRSRSCFAFEMECVTSKPVGYERASRTMAAELKRARHLSIPSVSYMPI